MISKKTVFILGAGASMDFGYPDGEELRTSIINNLKVKPSFVEQIARTLKKAPFPDLEDCKKTVKEFLDALFHNTKNTIDEFLEKFQKKYLLIGKLAIAQIIAGRENHDLLFNSDNWYRILLRKMEDKNTGDILCDNKISFITFNYDRSLEHFLYTSLNSHSEKLKEEGVKEIIKNIPIIHLYGQLDPLPWQDGSFVQKRPYGQVYTIDQFIEYGKTINIVFEKMNNEIQKRFDQAKGILKKAEIIYILGFGFHPINLERLKLEELKGKKIIATVLGIEDQKDIHSLIDKLEDKKMGLMKSNVYDLAKRNDFLNY